MPSNKEREVLLQRGGWLLAMERELVNDNMGAYAASSSAIRRRDRRWFNDMFLYRLAHKVDRREWRLAIIDASLECELIADLPLMLHELKAVDSELVRGRRPRLIRKRDRDRLERFRFARSREARRPKLVK